MKAGQYSTYGGPEVLEINEIDKPVCRENQVLVAVRSAAINPFDAKLRQGLMKDTIPLNFPVTIGADLCGSVVEVGPDVQEFKAGDEIYGSANVLGGGSGAAAEYAAANTKNIARKPANITSDQAAAAVLVGVSAVDVIDKLNLSAGKKVLIQGGAGGIGSAAVQYAKSRGAYVATTVRAAEKEFVAGLGADETIDYETERFEDLLHDYDAVFDTAGGEVYERSFAILKPGGIIISMTAQPDTERAATHKVTALLQSSKVTTDSLERLAKVIEQNIIIPQIDRVFGLSELAAAFSYLETGHPKGKVVIKIAE